MIYIAGSISSTARVLFSIVLIAEVYTTAVGALYGFVSRITNIETSPRKGAVIVVTATIGAMLASQFGFSNLVKYLYPLVGYGGVVLLASLIYASYLKRGQRGSGQRR
jgi:uncharacterized membrane protein YkvI